MYEIPGDCGTYTSADGRIRHQRNPVLRARSRNPVFQDISREQTQLDLDGNNLRNLERLDRLLDSLSRDLGQ
jgi:hypothetical protein